MANTHTWDVKTLQRETTDGYVSSVQLSLKTSDDTSEQENLLWVNLPKPGTLVPYADLTKSQVLTWAKDKLGNTRVTNEETAGDTRLADFKAIQYGTPW